ncbi:MAG TPA: amidohydrolase family protein [Terriglobales bacterium]|nr:amidohydrolase family protein [Terriglobales bacterium]
MSHMKARCSRAALLILALFLTEGLVYGQMAAKPQPVDTVIKNGTILTVTHGTIENGSILIRNGKIAEVGKTVNAPANARVIDATGKFVMPGIVDSHSHTGLNGDVNELTSVIGPHMMMADAFDYTDKNIYHALAGGTTTSMLMHGSGNMIGGQSVVIKHKFGLDRDELLFPEAPRSIKFASGENPKRVYGTRNQLPSTRMGNFAVQRAALQEAREYMRDWDSYDDKVKKGDKDAKPPKKDLKLDALADVLRGKILVQIHCYRADEFLTEIAMAKEFGYKLRAFHHGLEVYKVADKVAAAGVGLATFSDWWGYKVEAWDAIPWNAVIAMRKGVRVAIKSDSNDLNRHLNQEAAKMMRYGGATEEETLKMITLNAAWMLGVEDRVGSIEVGKDADITIWDKHPLSSYARVEKSIIDGTVYFDSSLPGYGLPFWKDAPMTGGGGSGSDDEGDNR